MQAGLSGWPDYPGRIIDKIRPYIRERAIRQNLEAEVVRPDYPVGSGRIIRFLQQFGGVLKLGFTSSVGGMAMQTSPTFRM